MAKVGADLSGLSNEELQEECESRGIWNEEVIVSDFTSMELAHELQERGETLPGSEIDALRLYDFLRDIPNVPQDIRDMIYDASGRILP